MARPSLKAQFFVAPNGDTAIKAKPVSPALRKQVYLRDGGKCQKCGCAVARFGNTVSPFSQPCAAVDHILARARGGQNTLDNLQLLCTSCNAAKGADRG